MEIDLVFTDPNGEAWKVVSTDPVTLSRTEDIPLWEMKPCNQVPTVEELKLLNLHSAVYWKFIPKDQVNLYVKAKRKELGSFPTSKINKDHLMECLHGYLTQRPHMVKFWEIDVKRAQLFASEKSDRIKRTKQGE